jgi:Ras-related C3 botulinum toxin substrate 1
MVVSSFLLHIKYSLFSSLPVISKNYRSLAHFYSLLFAAGQEDFDRLRTLSYPHTDCFLLCFSIISPHSFSNIENKWFPEIQQYAKGVPIVLCGTKCDRRNDKEVAQELHAKGQGIVTVEEGRELAKKIGASQYFECSALTQENIQLVFAEVVKQGLRKQESSQENAKQCCSIQ